MQSASLRGAGLQGVVARPASAAPRGRRAFVIRATSSGEQDAEDEALPKVPRQRRRRRKEKQEEGFSIDTLNPVTSE